MARARSIKPGFFANEHLIELAFEHRLLFAGLWTIADREGRLEDRPKKIKLQIFPGDNVDVDAGLGALQDKGFIRRYVVSGINYLLITNWSKHQTPHIKETASSIPAPEKAVQAPEGSERAALIPSSLTPDSPFPISHSCSLRSPPASPSKRTKQVRVELEPPEFSEIRSEYPSRAGGQRWGDALKFYLRNREAGVTHEIMLDGVRRYRAFLQATGDEGQKHVQQAATFLGDNKGYLELWHAPPKIVVLSPVERVMRANGLTGDNDERVVSEQCSNGSAEDLGDIFGNVRNTPSSGLRRIGS